MLLTGGKVSNIEPYTNKSILNNNSENLKLNLYKQIILLMRESTNEYYNMKMILDLTIIEGEGWT